MVLGAVVAAVDGVTRPSAVSLGREDDPLLPDAAAVDDSGNHTNGLLDPPGATESIPGDLPNGAITGGTRRDAGDGLETGDAMTEEGEHVRTQPTFSTTAAVSPVSPDFPDTAEEEVEEATEDRCHQEPDSGLCRAYLRMWYYNASTATCRRFTYGGCGGNDNNFPTERHCRAACPDEVPCPEDPTKICRVSESLCMNATCDLVPSAVCEVVPCTCDVHFFDEEGDPVQCEEPVTTTTTTTTTTSPPTTTIPTTTDDSDAHGDAHDGGDDDDNADKRRSILVHIVVLIVLVGLMMAVATLLALIYYRRRGKGGMYIFFTSPSRERGEITTPGSSSTCLTPYSHTEEKYTEYSSFAE